MALGTRIEPEKGKKLKGILAVLEIRAMLVINADDWGLRAAVTDAIADCFSSNRVSAVSAMVFMEDSERAAKIARETGVDAGLHINLTEAYTSDTVSKSLKQAQARTASFLRSSKLAPVVYNPWLRTAFQTTIAAQIEEFHRLYGTEPSHIDGHHHQHLSANVLFGGLLPAGSIVRRHFTFFPGEKSWANRTYRALCDRYLSRRCAMLDGFFDLAQYVGSERLKRLAELAASSVIEVMTHPAVSGDYQYLMGDDVSAWLDAVQLTNFRDLPKGRKATYLPDGT